jgi:cullin-associated NEDD8-dissociated protein 1
VDCIAQLTVREGKAALVELKSLLKSSIKVRMEILSAIRIVFSLRKSEVVDPLDKRMEEFDKALGELIPDFLSLMHDDEDLNVRRICLAAFNSCLHNRPDLLKVSMSGLLESLYNETNVRQDLIRIVDMGPFKHKVDDGLETRKAAYECLYSLIDVSSVYMSIDQLKFFKMVVQGLSDPSQEIQLMCHLIMIKLCHSYHSSKFTAYKKKIATFFVNVEAQEKLVKPLKEILTTKLKDSAVKQDIEKHTEMVRSAIRVLVLVSVEFLGMKIVNNGKFIVISKQKNTFPAVEAYLNELCDNNSLNSYLRTILEEESV